MTSTTTSGARAGAAAVRYARITLISDGPDEDQLPIDFASTLREAFTRGGTAERHRKVWRFGGLAPVAEREQVLGGRVGFIDNKATTRIAWNDELRDFVEVDTSDGSRFPFVVDLTTGRMAYQAQSSAGVLSAMQALLNSAMSGRWRIERVLDAQDWPTWRASVTRVQKLTFNLRRPNPDYAGREHLEQTMEGARAKALRAIYEADPDDLEGIDTEAVLIREMVDHANLDYGSYSATGTRVAPDGEEVEARYSSRPGGAERVDQLPVGTNAVVPREDMAAF